MKKVRRFLSKTAGALELPVDILAGVPKVDVVGFSECSIEPHKGLLEYGEQEIMVASTLGPIRVLGKGLYVRRMNGQRITICGTIRSVEREEKYCG